MSAMSTMNGFRPFLDGESAGTMLQRSLTSNELLSSTARMCRYTFTGLSPTAPKDLKPTIAMATDCLIPEETYELLRHGRIGRTLQATASLVIKASLARALDSALDFRWLENILISELTEPLRMQLEPTMPRLSNFSPNLHG